jgi:L-iditol 2-dehydrogenase
MHGLTKLAPGPGNVGIAERPEPAAAPGHVVLDVAAAGICGTDIHIYDGEYDSRPPVTMGHEVSGVVAELGDGVDGAWLGARVVTETYFSTCGRCAHCLAGRINLCRERRSIGSFVDGGFAPRLHVPARNLHRIPDWLDAHVAALTEPLACCCQSLLHPRRITEGDAVLVVGPGPIGLLAAQIAHAAGGEVHVRGTPRDAARLATAGALGFATSTTDHGAVGDFDVVVECSGHEAGMAFALESARRGGRYVQIGLAGKPVSIPFDLVCFGELSVTSGNASTPESWRLALELIAERRVDLAPLFSEAVPLAEWEHAFAATRSGVGIKYVLVP